MSDPTNDNWGDTEFPKVDRERARAAFRAASDATNRHFGYPPIDWEEVDRQEAIKAVTPELWAWEELVAEVRRLRDLPPREPGPIWLSRRPA